MTGREAKVLTGYGSFATQHANPEDESTGTMLLKENQYLVNLLHEIIHFDVMLSVLSCAVSDISCRFRFLFFWDEKPGFGVCLSAVNVLCMCHKFVKNHIHEQILVIGRFFLQSYFHIKSWQIPFMYMSK